MSTGLGHAYHYEAFGSPPDAEEERRARRAAKFFKVAAWVLLAASISTGAVAFWRFHRARTGGP